MVLFKDILLNMIVVSFHNPTMSFDLWLDPVCDSKESQLWITC